MLSWCMRPFGCSNGRYCTHMPVGLGILHCERVAELQLSCQPGLGCCRNAALCDCTVINRAQPSLCLGTASTATSCSPAQEHGRQVQRTLCSHSGVTLLLTNLYKLAFCLYEQTVLTISSPLFSSNKSKRWVMGACITL